MTMLASDLNNPEFVGPQNPDDLLQVEFHMFEAIDGWASMEASQKAQRKVVVKRPPEPYILIQKPGDMTSTLHVPVRETHKQRWPRQWLYFQMNEGLLEQKVDPNGWKLEDWNRFKDDPGLLADLKHRHFNTVEQLAGMTDMQIQFLGMSGSGLRLDAQQALRNRQNQTIAEKDLKIQELQENMEKLTSMVQKLVNPEPKPEPLAALPQTSPSNPNKKRMGRPPKVKEPAVG